VLHGHAIAQQQETTRDKRPVNPGIDQAWQVI